MHEGVLKFAQTIAPGKELRDFTPPAIRKDFFDVVKSRLDRDRLQRLREEFDTRSIHELRRTLGEIPEVMQSLMAELRERGIDTKIDLYPYTGGSLLCTCGWWVTINWRAVGLMRDSYLSLVKWRGRPNVPGLNYSLDSARRVSEHKYHFGLARVDEFGWIEPGSPDVALGTRDVLERLLTEMFERPNTEPPPFWDGVQHER
jgi:hypothetical protein